MKKKSQNHLASVVFSLLAFAMLLCFSKSMVYAKDHLSKGDIFYYDDLKYKVVEESSTLFVSSGKEFKYGKAQVVGLNPDRSQPFQVSIKSYVRCAETGEEFFIVSVAKNAFKNNALSRLCIEYSFAPNTGVRDYYFPSLNIMSGSFKNCSDLEEIEIHGAQAVNLTIEKNAFKGCKNLKYIGCSSNNVINPPYLKSVKDTIKIKKGAFAGIKKINVCYSVLYSTMRNHEGSDKEHKALAKMIKKSGVKTVKYWYAYKMRKVK